MWVSWIIFYGCPGLIVDLGLVFVGVQKKGGNLWVSWIVCSIKLGNVWVSRIGRVNFEGVVGSDVGMESV